jgi:acetolactate synthase-1/2/3 large subunit
MLNGADALVSASRAAGVEVCFANPGTTEMALVAALARAKALRAVPVIFEGVASGAADGYARLAGKPASVLLHLGPGLGNATANLHNARRAPSPVVVWVGDHASWILPHDPPLASDIATLARATSKWLRTVRTVDSVAADAVDAIEAAISPVAGVATLVLPADLVEAALPAGFVLPPAAPARPRVRALAPEAIERVAGRVRAAGRPLFLLGGAGTDRAALLDASRLAEKVGGTVLYEQFPRFARREAGLPAPDKMAYFPAPARAQLAGHDLVVLLGASVPVPFFGYAGDSPRLAPDGATVVDAVADGADVHAVLAALCDALDAPPRPAAVAQRAAVAEPSGPLAPHTIAQAIARHLPEDAIVVDEGITGSAALYPALRGAAAHDYLACKGGSIGFATPVATGAAVAAPGRRVLTYVGDGSAAYTLQSLWTQAREGLDVTTVVLANDRYAILQLELTRAGGALEGAAVDLTELGRPSLDFAELARGYGAAGRTVRDSTAFAQALAESFATPGPTLIACAFR